MCGRITRYYTWREIWSMYEGIKIDHPDEEPERDFNLPPTRPTWVLVPSGDRNGRVDARMMRWGLVPAWAKDPKGGYNTCNARVESAATKPSFREAWKRRHCLVPVSGYFEWPGEEGEKHKQPFYIRHREAPVLMLAGLYETWARDGQLVDSFTIVTMDSDGPVRELHDRMPLVIPPAMARDWLEGDGAAAAAIAQAAPVPDLRFHPVTKAVGAVKNNGPTMIEPIDI
jgi:putative SOS response-associated peptidase YedK